MGDRVSLRTQLVAALVALLAVALIGTGLATALALRTYLEDRADEQLRAAGLEAVRTVTRDGRPGRGGPRRGPPSQYAVAVLGPEGTPVETFGNADVDLAGLPALTPAEVESRGGRPFGIDGARAVAFAAGPGASVVVATPLGELRGTFRQLVVAELVVGAVALTVLGLLGWLLVTRSLRPLGRIEETAEAIAAGDLSQRVPERAAPGTEVGRLSRALNGMLAQIERAFRARAESEERMRSFVADASHELRTPLTSIRGFAELHRQGAVTTEAETTAAFRRIEGAAVRMGGLVDDLLLLARLDEQRPLDRVPVDLAAVAADAVADLRAVAPDRDVRLTRLGGSPVVTGDEARLRQVVSNLLSNARTHTPPGSPVTVAVGVRDGRALVEVADEGPGLSPEQSARVFDRFYRGDASRSRAAGGSGLGLSIVAAIVAAHSGEVSVHSRPGRGATFRVELPALSASSQVG